MTGKKIRVLVTDDSLVSREIISRGISTDPDIEVIAKAVDAFDARDKILKVEPDVMICDIEMPRMSGIEFIRRLIPQYPLPVIVVSRVSDAVFEAMNAGAVDFVTKPDVDSFQGVSEFLCELITKIKIAANARVTQSRNELPSNPVIQIGQKYDKIIAIGASTGGTEALYEIIKNLPSDIPGILIVQHIPPMFSRLFSERLDKQTNLHVKEAQTGDYVEQGKVLIAPGDQHIRIRRIADRYKVEAFYADKVNGHCPSVDVLFESVARETRGNAVGIILTGMGSDGAKGLLSMRKAGARTIGQDENSCVVYGMPKVAYEIGAVEKQYPLSAIPKMLLKMLK
jgi:two-component system, chemotaxis family, protein-glutamate methylesterase/glutaminase